MSEIRPVRLFEPSPSPDLAQTIREYVLTRFLCGDSIEQIAERNPFREIEMPYDVERVLRDAWRARP